jgi:AbrB family looped-hinge helix DNA binding protein
MELAKISTRGQITLPLSIRKRLGVSDGDKVVFLEENGHVIVENAFTIELKVSPESQTHQVLPPQGKNGAAGQMLSRKYGNSASVASR